MDTKSISRKKQRKKAKSALQEELKSLRDGGASLWLEGTPGTPKEIARACMIQEEGTYMRDYVPDEKGGIREVRFDKIK